MAARSLFDQPLSPELAQQLRARATLCDDATGPGRHRAGLGRLPTVSRDLKAALGDCADAYRSAAAQVDRLAGAGVRDPSDPGYPAERMLALHKRIIDAARRLRTAHRRAALNRRSPPQDHRGR